MQPSKIISRPFRWQDLGITREDIIHCLGSGDNGLLNILDLEGIEGNYGNIGNAMAGFVVYDNVTLSMETFTLKAGGQDLVIGPLLAPRFSGIEHLALFICNAGYLWEQRAKELFMAGEMLEGYLVDSLGLAVTDKLTSLVQKMITGEMHNTGLSFTNIYSPGYCRWELTEQQKLFNLLPYGFCGVTLSDSCLMSPVKSVSGIIGIGKSVSDEGHQCEICEMQACYLRKN